MILICDKSRSERALSFRNRLRKLGCPCAASAVSEIRDFLPVLLIVTWCDVFDDVRRTPYEDIPVIAIGSGFVNTALNARRTDNEDTAVRDIREHLYRKEGIQGERILMSGVFASETLFLGPGFFELHGRRVCPTETEYLIFKYLFGCSKAGHCADAERIALFCCADPAKPDARRNTVTVQIANLNAKLEIVCGFRPIRAIRGRGYLIDKIA